MFNVPISSFLVSKILAKFFQFFLIMTSTLIDSQQAVFSRSNLYSPVAKAVELLSASEDFSVKVANDHELIVSDSRISEQDDSAIAILALDLVNLADVVKLTKSFVEDNAQAKYLIWIAPTCPESCNLGKKLSEAEAIVSSSQKKH